MTDQQGDYRPRTIMNLHDAIDAVQPIVDDLLRRSGPPRDFRKPLPPGSLPERGDEVEIVIRGRVAYSVESEGFFVLHEHWISGKPTCLWIDPRDLKVQSIRKITHD